MACSVPALKISAIPVTGWIQAAGRVVRASPARSTARWPGLGQSYSSHGALAGGGFALGVLLCTCFSSDWEERCRVDGQLSFIANSSICFPSLLYLLAVLRGCFLGEGRCRAVAQLSLVNRI